MSQPRRLIIYTRIFLCMDLYINILYVFPAGFVFEVCFKCLCIFLIFMFRVSFWCFQHFLNLLWNNLFAEHLHPLGNILKDDYNLQHHFNWLNSNVHYNCSHRLLVGSLWWMTQKILSEWCTALLKTSIVCFFIITKCTALRKHSDQVLHTR